MIDQTNETIESAVRGFPDNVRAEREYVSTKPYDAIVIGAGLCGIIFMAYAREKGLRCVALEKQSDVGGLWNRLPSWQDLQNRRQDIALDGVPLDGVDQPAVHRYAREWVRRFGLDPSVRLGCEVTNVSWVDGGWTVHTKQGEVLRTNHLVDPTGEAAGLAEPAGVGSRAKRQRDGSRERAHVLAAETPLRSFWDL